MPLPGPRAHRVAAALALAALVVTLPACGDGRKKVYPVRGRILVDGKPAAEAGVTFNPVKTDDAKLVTPFGQADADGNFAISSYVSGDGAPPGEYVVTFTWNERSGLFKSDFLGPDRLKGRYASVTKSTFRVTIEPKPTELPPFELTNP